MREHLSPAIEMNERVELMMEGRTMEEIIVFIAKRKQEDPRRDYYLSGDQHAVVSRVRP